MLPNYKVPETTAHYRAMVHVPRRPYVEALPGIPTIRPFEAMACGIPLISAYWNDEEHLFSEGKDYLLARNPKEMRDNMQSVLTDRETAKELARNGVQTIQDRHTCAHRARQLLEIIEELRSPVHGKAEALCATSPQ
jgi:spore maturation protein CgeB